MNQFIDNWEEKTNIKSSIVGEFLINVESIRYLPDYYSSIFLVDIKNLEKGDCVIINSLYCVLIGYSRIDHFAMFKCIKKL